jgi:CheY-like chemotaxis protein
MTEPARRILVVDDNPINLKLARVVLRDAGFEVRAVMNATEALADIAVAPPDLILMDIQLPGMDGLTLTRRLKANDATSRIRVVAMTAYAMKGDAGKALAAGCDGYLTKPIDTRTLPSTVAGYLADSVKEPS